MPDGLRQLAPLRRKIDRLDRRLLLLLNARLAVAAAIGRVKRGAGVPAYAPEREEVVLRGLERRTRGLLGAEDLRAIYREILSASRALEEPLRVAYFGPEGTFTHLAARARFGAQATYRPVRSIGDVFYEVDRRNADYGVVPVENSTEGAVNHTLDMFMESDLKICAEAQLPISLMLMSRAGDLRRIRTVFSHAQPLAQCRRWLEEKLHWARPVEVGSTAVAAQRAAATAGAAAIGTALAADLHGLPVLARNIEDLAGNTTRFFVLARAHARRTGQDKTSVMFAVKDRVGALYDMLQPFRRSRINLTSIESRPSRKRPWEYYFFVDMAGHVEDRAVAAALKSLEPQCTTFKLLGSYPAAAPARR